MTKRDKILLSVFRIALPALLTILWLGFIFGNSLRTGAESGESSGRVHALVNAIPELLGLGSPISHHFVRKAAHFTEFAILALLVCSDLWCARAVTLNSSLRRILPTLAASLPICAVCATVDELLQNFADGRGPSVKDVLIDSSGALFSIIIFISLFCIIRNIKNKYVLNNTTNVTSDVNI